MWNYKKFSGWCWGLVLVLQLFGFGNSEAGYLVNASYSSVVWCYTFYDAPGNTGNFIIGPARTMAANTFETISKPAGVPAGGYWYAQRAATAADAAAGNFIVAIGITEADVDAPNVYARLSEGLTEKWIGRLLWRNQSDEPVTVYNYGNAGSTVLPVGAQFHDRALINASGIIGIGSQPQFFNARGGNRAGEMYWVPSALDALIEGTYVKVFNNSGQMGSGFELTGAGQPLGGGVDTSGTPPGGGSGSGMTTTTNVVNVDLQPVTTAVQSVTSAVGAVVSGIGSLAMNIIGLGGHIDNVVSSVQNAYAGMVTLITELKDKVVGIADFLAETRRDVYLWFSDFKTALVNYHETRDETILLNEQSQNDYAAQWASYYDMAVADPSLGDPISFANASVQSPLRYSLNHFTPTASIDYENEPWLSKARWTFIRWYYEGLNLFFGLIDFVQGWAGAIAAIPMNMVSFGQQQLNVALADAQANVNMPHAGMTAYIEGMQIGTAAKRAEVTDAINGFLSLHQFSDLKTFLATDSALLTGVQMVREDWVITLPSRMSGGGTYNKAAGGAAAGQGKQISLFPGDHPNLDLLMKFLRCLIAWSFYLAIVWFCYGTFTKKLMAFQILTVRAPPANQSVLGINLNWKAVLVNSIFYITVLLAFITSYATMFVLFDVDCCALVELVGAMNASKSAQMAVGLLNWTFPLDCVFQGMAAYVFFEFAWLPIGTGFMTLMKTAHV